MTEERKRKNRNNVEEEKEEDALQEKEDWRGGQFKGVSEGRET